MLSKEEREEMDRIDELLKEDAASITLDDDFLEKSFERLQAKMSYSKNVIKFEQPQKRWFRFGASVAACAAVFAAVFIPFYSGKVQVPADNLTPIVSSSIKPIAKNKIIVDDSLNSEKISVAVRSKKTETENSESEFSNSIENSTVIPNLDKEFEDSLASVDIYSKGITKQKNIYDFPVNIPETHTVKNYSQRNGFMPENYFGR